MKEKRHLQQIRENNVTYINVSKEKYVLKKDKKSWKYYLFSTNSMWCGPHPGLQYFNTFNWKYQSIKPVYPWKYFFVTVYVSLSIFCVTGIGKISQIIQNSIPMKETTTIQEYMFYVKWRNSEIYRFFKIEQFVKAYLVEKHI